MLAAGCSVALVGAGPVDLGVGGKRVEMSAMNALQSRCIHERGLAGYRILPNSMDPRRLDQYVRGEIDLATLIDAGPQLNTVLARGVRDAIAAGRTAEALEIIEGLIQLELLDPVPHAWKGWLLLELKQPELAAEAFSAARARAPEAGVFHAWHIAALLECGRFERAAQEMQVMLGRDPEAADPATTWAAERVRSVASRLGLGSTR